MDSINGYVKEYIAQLREGHIQKAYKGIMAFMSEMRTYLENTYPNCAVGALYFGYMDMTYFAFTPSLLKNMKLKIAIVFLHEECRFELWLAANNRKIQADYIELLRRKNIGKYTLSQVAPGVDSIITLPITEQPDFDNPGKLKKQLEEKALEFANDVAFMLKG